MPHTPGNAVVGRCRWLRFRGLRLRSRLPCVRRTIGTAAFVGGMQDCVLSKSWTLYACIQLLACSNPVAVGHIGARGPNRLSTDHFPAGQKPIIPPGDCFEYVSGTDLDTKSGLQSGRLEVGSFHIGRLTSTLWSQLPMQLCMHNQMGHQCGVVMLYQCTYKVSASASAHRKVYGCRVLETGLI